jgi:glycosyltransferase involved in cell wall biosynthesis
MPKEKGSSVDVAQAAAEKHRSSRLNELVRQGRRIGAAGFPVPDRLRAIMRWLRRRTMRLEIASPSALKPGLALIGYPRAEFGLGEALRLLASAVERSSLPYSAFDIDHGIWARQGDQRLAHRISPSLDRRLNLLVHSPNDAGHALDLLGLSALTGRHNILYAFWELPELPDAWVARLARFDEIWAPSRFVAGALGAKLGGPAFVLPLPMELPLLPPRTRADFGLPSDRFLFQFSFDFSSMAERKNPWGVIAAFRKCAASLPPGRIGLVLKTMGQGHGPSDRRRLRQATDGAGDIFVIDRVLDRPDVLALQALCDCFVSLHRAEGFGLGIAEAMALARPVVATNFGGSTDLLGFDRACPVGYKLVPVPAGQYPGGEGQFWAAPDLDEAAARMRRIAEDGDWARRLGTAGQKFVQRMLSPESIGTQIGRRLSWTESLSAEPSAAWPARGAEQRHTPASTGSR